MKDYSIENAINKINSEKTREYFKEVASSYYNENYRASIVTLYSVVITDIIVKLETLDEIYTDKIANEILEEIKAFQKANPNNPDWEKTIIDKVRDRTNLLDNVDYVHIQALKSDRNLCAHPVIDKGDKLYTPSKELVASHIRNMLESLFLKPAILSKKILSTLLADIAEKKEIFIDEESIEKYIKSKYLNNLNSSIEVTIFRDLWKFIFSLENPNADENRQINYKTLYFLYKRNISICIEKIKSEKEYFSNIKDNTLIIHYLINFLSENEFLYNEFREDVHILITNTASKEFSAKVAAWFLSKSYLEHLKKLKIIISKNIYDNYKKDATIAYQKLIKVGFSKGYNKEVVDFIIWRHSRSTSFDEADRTFTYVVKPFLSKFTKEDLKVLCNKINLNSQTYDRKKAEDDFVFLKKYIMNNVDKDFDFSAYPNLN